MLESIQSGPLVYPTIKENGQVRDKKYAQLTEQEKLQDDYDVQALNIVLQGLPPDVYALVNHCMTMQQVQVNTKFLNALQPEWSKFVTDVKLAKNMYNTNFDQLYAYLSQHEGHANEARMMCDRYQILLHWLLTIKLRDDPIACLNKAIAFMSTVVASHFPSTNNQLRTSSNPRNQATIQDGRVTVQQVQGRQEDSRILDGQAIQTTIPQNAAFQTDDLDAYDSDCDDISSAKAVLMANLLSYDSDILSENFEQSLIDYVPDTEITSDSNIISYEQYLQQTQNASVQDANSSAQQDSLIISMFEQISEQMSSQVTHWEKVNQETITVNESLTAELERYKERVKTFKQRFNVDLNIREKMIDSQINDMIRDRCALKQEIDSLKQSLSKQVKEKESLLQTLTVFKKESKEKEDKYMDK
ncbi:hypothetical protein Tco_0677123 [Tanacetum coccineum]